MAGFEALRDSTGADAGRYLRPMPRLAEGQKLAPYVSAMMDISDGLLLDAWRMGEASSVTLALDAGAVPLAVAEDRRADALRWGDDYELLFTAPAGADLPVLASAIGKVEPRGASPLMLGREAVTGPEGLGYRH